MDAWLPAAFYRAKGTPSSSAVTSGSPLPPIRAPLSGDTDDDHDGDYYSSEASAKSDGVASRFSDDSASFLSGDDEFETASETPWDASERFEDELVEEKQEEDGDGGRVPIVRSYDLSSSPGIYGPAVTMVPVAKLTSETEDEDCEVRDGVSSDGDGGFIGVVRIPVETGQEGLVGGRFEEESWASEGVGLGKESGAAGGTMKFFDGGQGKSDFISDPIAETLGSVGTSSLEATSEHVKYSPSMDTIMVEASVSGVVGERVYEEPFMTLGSKGSTVAKREDPNGAASCINVGFGKETVVLDEALMEGMVEAGSSNDGSTCLVIETEMEPVSEAIDAAEWEFQTSSYVGMCGNDTEVDGSDPRGRLQDNQLTPRTSSQGPNDSDIRNKQELDADDGSIATGDNSDDLNFVRELENFVKFSRNSDVRFAENRSTASHIMEAADSEEEEEYGDDDKVLFDSATLTALLKAASNVNARSTSQNPAGLGSSVPALGLSAPRRISSAGNFASSATRESETENMDDEEKKLHDKINTIRMNFLRLVHRLGQSLDESAVAQVLYRLALAEGTRNSKTTRLFSLDAAFQTAKKLEEDGKEEIDFSCTILVIGRTGVGKSATINSIFGEDKVPTDAFQPATSMVRVITGIVDGVKLRVIDTPGLRPSVMEQRTNRKILSSVKKFMKKFPPDIIFYVDRMDICSRDTNNLPLLESITSNLGASIWFNVTVALTHASSAPPEGPSGSPLPYETLVSHRSQAVQNSIRQAAGDMRLMNQVVLVENHPSCRRNQRGHQVLPNGQSWRPRLLLLCHSSKILTEVNSLLRPQDPAITKLLFGGHRYRSVPVPFLLSSLLQSGSHPSLASADHEEAYFEMEEELPEADTDEEEYDQLPPFKPLGKSQIAKLSKEQRKAYFQEYDYRVKLFQKKQLKEELSQRREAKKLSGSCPRSTSDESDPENADPPSIQVPLPDMLLPSTFDGDSPAYRYRSTDFQLLVRPVLDSHGWDHDCGYDGISLEDNRTVAGRFPAGLVLQITKDKKEFSIHMDSSIAMKHGDHGSTMAAFDVQSLGKQLAYTFRGESKFKSFKKNRTAAGLSFTHIGEALASGIKIEDQISIGRRATLSASTGAMSAQGDVAYGANLEARIMEKDYPIGQDGTTLGLSLMQWRRDLALGANLQTQFSVGRGTKTSVRIGLNNKGSGQITVRTSSSEQLQIALIGLLPVAAAIFRSIVPGESQVLH
ncbi:Translocase of chloroplast 159 [Nymphaea thermarum]|nr:Translocase of chloroplast 159 [Nymphaea thermarum]